MDTDVMSRGKAREGGGGWGGMMRDNDESQYFCCRLGNWRQISQ